MKRLHRPDWDAIFINAGSARPYSHSCSTDTCMATKASDWFVKPLIVTIIGGFLVGIPVALFQVRLDGDSGGRSAFDATTRRTINDSGVHVAALNGETNTPARATLPVVEKFSYALGVHWGPFFIGMPRDQIEAQTGPLQCTVEDYDGYYCSCHSVYEGVAVFFELRPEQHQPDDSNVCMRRDLGSVSMSMHFTPAEHAASLETLTGVLRAQLPQFRHLRGSLYTFADGTYNLVLDPEGKIIHIVHYMSE